MVLTPDQKKRIAELESQSSTSEAEGPSGSGILAGRAKASTLTLLASLKRIPLFQVAVVLALLCTAVYFVSTYQLHKIDFRSVFSSGRGSPIGNLIEAVQVQKKKTAMLEESNGQFVAGDYGAALATATNVMQLDANDGRATRLIDLIADAATQRAIRELDSGAIENALTDVRLALKYRPEHAGARELVGRIASRLLHEASVHYHKKEYPQLITKAQEVLRIEPSNIDAMNLLMQSNNELLAKGGELFISKRYLESLEKVQLAMRIDPANPRANRLLNQISLYVETPKVDLLGIVTLGNTPYARLQLPNTRQIVTVKEGDTIRNFKVLDIDPASKRVKILQLHTRQEFVVGQEALE